MKIHHTKTLGDLGVLKAQLDLHHKKFWVSIPHTEHAPFDLVITQDGKSRTVQVKARHANNGIITINFRQSYSTKRGVKTSKWNKKEINLVCVYCPETDLCYYFDPSQFKDSITLRVETPKNSQKSGIHFADDYREVP